MKLYQTKGDREMSAESQYQKDEQSLEDELDAGDISNEEYSTEMRNLQRSYREEAEEAAQDAYDNEMSNW